MNNMYTITLGYFFFSHNTMGTAVKNLRVGVN